MTVKKSLLTAFAFLFTLLYFSCKKELTQTPVTLQTADATTALATAAKAKNGPFSIVYVEVNSNNILNAGCYTLKNGGQQLFDAAAIFAANINYDVAKKKAVLFNNRQVSIVLSDTATYIQPLHDKGIKVLLTILGNHQGAGISNFTSRAAAHDFAKQLSDTVRTYHLDGIDFDDEYSDYGNNGTTQPNDSSFVLLLSELRKLMPKKLITFYFFGPASTRLSYGGKKAGDYLNYSWNAVYGSFQVPQVPGLAKSQLVPAADWINTTDTATAKRLAQQTKNGGYGGYLYYDLTNRPSDKYLSVISKVLYNDSVTVDPGCLKTFPPPPPKDTTGVVFYEDENYGGAHTLPIPKGDHILSELIGTYGFQSNWASSATLPNGWKMRIYYTPDLKNDKGMLITQDTATFGGFYNDFVNSVRIR